MEQLNERRANANGLVFRQGDLLSILKAYLALVEHQGAESLENRRAVVEKIN